MLLEVTEVVFEQVVAEVRTPELARLELLSFSAEVFARHWTILMP